MGNYEYLGKWEDNFSATAFIKLLKATVQVYFDDTDRQSEMPAVLIEGLTSEADNLVVGAGQQDPLEDANKLPAIYLFDGGDVDAAESISPRQLGVYINNVLINPRASGLASGTIVLRVCTKLKTEGSMIRDDVHHHLRLKRDYLADYFRLEALSVEKGTDMAKAPESTYFQGDIILTWHRRYNMYNFASGVDET